MEGKRQAEKPRWEMLYSTFPSWQSLTITHISLIKAPSSPVIKYCLERQIRTVVKSLGFTVKASVDLNLSPVAYWLCDLGNYPTEFYFTLL